MPNAQNALRRLGVYDAVSGCAYHVPQVHVFGRGKADFIINAPLLTLNRDRLDQILRDKFEEAGGNVLYKKSMTHVSIMDNSVSVMDSDGQSHSGDVLVLATGADIRLARGLGFEFVNKPVASVRGYMENVAGADEYYMWFDSAAAPSYGWVFPCPGNLVNVGVYLGGKMSNTAHECLYQFLHTKAKAVLNGARFISQPKGWRLRTGLRQQENYGNRVILVGENIDCTYELTGEGIGNALQSGILAAETISEANPHFGSEALSPYQAKIELMRGFHSGYSRAKRLLSYAAGNFLFSQLLMRSSRARDTLGSIIREEQQPDALFSMVKALDYV